MKKPSKPMGPVRLGYKHALGLVQGPGDAHNGAPSKASNGKPFAKGGRAGKGRC